MHGEYYRKWSKDIRDLETPPYARGIHVIPSKYVDDSRNTPVCTGNTFHLGTLYNHYEKHPRMHGEYDIIQQQFNIRIETPPYARGIRDG